MATPTRESLAAMVDELKKLEDTLVRRDLLSS
jgi:hypothetical protein